MGLMMLPLFLLYLISILFAVLARRDRTPRKKMTRKNKIILLVLSIIIAAGLIVLYIQFPKQFVKVTDQIVNIPVSWWKEIQDFFTSIVNKISKL